MATTLRVSAETRRRLTELAGSLTARTGRRVTYDEALRHLLNAGSGPPRAEGPSGRFWEMVRRKFPGNREDYAGEVEPDVD